MALRFEAKVDTFLWQWFPFPIEICGGEKLPADAATKPWAAAEAEHWGTKNNSLRMWHIALLQLGKKPYMESWLPAFFSWDKQLSDFTACVSLLSYYASALLRKLMVFSLTHDLFSTSFFRPISMRRSSNIRCVVLKEKLPNKLKLHPRNSARSFPRWPEDGHKLVKFLNSDLMSCNICCKPSEELSLGNNAEVWRRPVVVVFL